MDITLIRTPSKANIQLSEKEQTISMQPYSFLARVNKVEYIFRFYKFAIFISLKSPEGVSQISRSSHRVILASHYAIERREQGLIIKKKSIALCCLALCCGGRLYFKTCKKNLFCHLDSVYR